jgi:hypothetical protein
MDKLEAVENATPHRPLGICSRQRYYYNYEKPTKLSQECYLKQLNKKDKRLNGKDKQLKEFTNTWTSS